MKLKHIVGLLSAAAMSAVIAGSAAAQDKTVKIGAIFPLSGNAASAGVHAKAAIETAVEIINSGNPALGNLPVTKNAGLKGLGGAKVEVVFADNQGSPATGQNQALRLITEEKVVALTGAYQSGITLTASAIAEKYGIPFVNGESVAANLTERGFKWFFRTTPVAGDFAKIYLDFLKEMKAGGQKVDNIALVHENTEYGTSVANVITGLFKENGLPIAQDIAYSANTTDVQSQVLQLKDKKPDVVIMISYTSDAILYAKTFQALDYKPPMMIADNAGYSDPSTLKAVGKQIQGIFNRSSFAIGAAGIADLPDQRDLQEEERRRRSRRYRGAPDAGLLRAGRCDRSRRLDRTRQDPGGAEGHRPQARSVDHGLQGREVRRQGPERAGRRTGDPAAGRRELRAGLAEATGQDGARVSLQGLVMIGKGRDFGPALFDFTPSRSR